MARTTQLLYAAPATLRAKLESLRAKCDLLPRWRSEFDRGLFVNDLTRSPARHERFVLVAFLPEGDSGRTKLVVSTILKITPAVFAARFPTLAAAADA